MCEYSVNRVTVCQPVSFFNIVSTPKGGISQGRRVQECASGILTKKKRLTLNVNRFLNSNKLLVYEMIRSFLALLSTPNGVPAAPLAQRTDAGFMGMVSTIGEKYTRLITFTILSFTIYYLSYCIIGLPVTDNEELTITDDLIDDW